MYAKKCFAILGPLSYDCLLNDITLELKGPKKQMNVTYPHLNRSRLVNVIFSCCPTGSFMCQDIYNSVE